MSLAQAQHAPTAKPDLRGFDFQAAAELFMTKAKLSRRPPITYRRFPTAAEAIRFAVEELPAASLAGVVLEIDGERFDHAAISDLYADAAYPLSRRPLG